MAASASALASLTASLAASAVSLTAFSAAAAPMKEMRPTTRPASAISPNALSMDSRASSETPSCTERIGVFIETLAFDLMPRSAARASPAWVSSSGETAAAAASYVSAFGHAAWCTEPSPSCIQLHTSSVAYGRYGASRRAKASKPSPSAVRADFTAFSLGTWPVESAVPYARFLTSSM